MSRKDTANYLKIFTEDIPILDVRAPVEFEKGAFPNAVNRPLMTNEERHLVGIKYKESGQDAAIKLGHELVSGELKAARVKVWQAFAGDHPNGYLYCFRGGLRSRTSQQFLKDAGVNYPLIEGGYKAMRRFLIEALDRIVEEHKFIIVGGRTGSGKTLLLKDVECMVDLEGLANHKGSSFGRSIEDNQPSQISFENALAIDCLKRAEESSKPIFLEDESPRIGRLSIPNSMVEMMKKAEMVLIDEPLEERINIIQKDYVTDLLASHVSVFAEDGFDRYSEFLLSGLDRVKKRLGGKRHADIRHLMQAALNHQLTTHSEDLHRAWIERLLSDYYDPMYDYQLSKKDQPIIFKGTRKDILHWYHQQERQL